MKTVQTLILSLTIVTSIISCKKDSDTSTDGDPVTAAGSYSFTSAQAYFQSDLIVFDQFSKQGNTITAKKKKYFKRQASSPFNDSIEFIVQYEVLKDINRAADFGVKGPDVKVSFSYITSVPNPGTTFTHQTTNGTIHVSHVDQTAKTIDGTFNWIGEIEGATPTITQELSNGSFSLSY